MITYNFGDYDTFYASLIKTLGWRLKFWPRLQAQASFLAQNLAGAEVTPDHVFWVFDKLHPDWTRFPRYPRGFLHTFCRDRDFRRACYRYWNEQEESLYNNIDANVIDPMTAGIIWLFYLAFSFALIVVVAPILPFPLDTATVAAVIILFCFIRVMDAVIGTAFGVSARLVRRGIKLARLRKQARMNG